MYDATMDMDRRSISADCGGPDKACIKVHQSLIKLEQDVFATFKALAGRLTLPLYYSFKQPSCRRSRSVHVDYSGEVPADSRAACFQIQDNVQMSENKQRSSNCVAQSS